MRSYLEFVFAGDPLGKNSWELIYPATGRVGEFGVFRIAIRLDERNRDELQVLVRLHAYDRQVEAFRIQNHRWTEKHPV